MAEESFYKRRIAQGLCGVAKCPNKIEPPSTCHCAQHAEASRQRTAARREKKRANLECVEEGCHAAVAKAGGRCDKHKATQARARKDSAERLMQEGLCRNARSHGPAKEGCTLCQGCIDNLSAVSSEHYRRRKEAGLCRYGNEPSLPGESMCAYHKERYKDRRLQIKIQALEAYGGVRCVGFPGECEAGCVDPEVLHLDHVDGAGNVHRRSLGVRGGTDFYQKLKDAGYPQEPKLRVLCPTCNARAYAAARQTGSAKE